MGTMKTGEAKEKGPSCGGHISDAEEVGLHCMFLNWLMDYLNRYFLEDLSRCFL